MNIWIRGLTCQSKPPIIEPNQGTTRLILENQGLSGMKSRKKGKQMTPKDIYLRYLRHNG